MSKITKQDVKLSAIQVHGAGEMVSATLAFSVIEQLEDQLDKAHELLSELRERGDYGSELDGKITRLIA